MVNIIVKIGLIGGSGLDNPDILKDAKDIEVKTVYGEPTSPLKGGKIHEPDQKYASRVHCFHL